VSSGATPWHWTPDAQQGTSGLIRIVPTPTKQGPAMLSFLNRLVTWWNGQTIGTQLFTARKGVRVGEDGQGNIYYHTVDDARRWVISNGEAEASRIDAEWHGWLHRTWDEAPTDKPVVHKVWEKPHLPNLTGTGQAYAPAGSIRRTEPADRRDYEAWSPE